MMQPTRVNLQNIQTAHTTQKQQQTDQNMGKRPKETFLHRRHIDEQQTHEKMLKTANYQRNANQNYNEVSPHTDQNGHH